MRRYVTRAQHLCDDAWRSDWEDGAALRPGMTVMEHRREEPQWSGLVDQHGNELYRAPDETRPVGFLAKWTED